MIDIHCHILPSLDDGAADMAAAAKMLAAAADDGVNTIICTPHGSPIVYEKLPKAIELLQPQATALNISLLPGMEYRFGHLNDSMNQLRPLAGSSFILVDFHRSALPQAAEGVFFDLSRRGYQVIVAHPERSFSDFKDLEKLQSLGAYFQVNAGSFLGKSGKTSLNMAKRILERGLCYYIGSDAHGEARTFHFKECRKQLENLYGLNCVEIIMDENPARLLKNLSPKPAIPEKKLKPNICQRLLNRLK